MERDRCGLTSGPALVDADADVERVGGSRADLDVPPVVRIPAGKVDGDTAVPTRGRKQTARGIGADVATSGFGESHPENAVRPRDCRRPDDRVPGHGRGPLALAILEAPFDGIRKSSRRLRPLGHGTVESRGQMERIVCELCFVPGASGNGEEGDEGPHFGRSVHRTTGNTTREGRARSW
jgi:hypothetical protein